MGAKSLPIYESEWRGGDMCGMNRQETRRRKREIKTVRETSRLAARQTKIVTKQHHCEMRSSLLGYFHSSLSVCVCVCGVGCVCVCESVCVSGNECASVPGKFSNGCVCE